MKRLFSFLTVVLLLAACGGNPYQKGQKLASKYDACMEDYFNALVQVGEDFSGKLPGNYNSRTKAMEDYLQLLRECHQTYLEKWEKIDAEERHICKKLKSSDERSEFESGLLSDRECYAFASVPDMETIEISPAVLQQVRKIIPPKPNETQIALDLVGHSLSEGKEDGYYPQSWTWKISEGGVSDLKIVSTEENTNSRYTITVTMRLSSETRAYDTKAQVSYVLGDVSDWEIEFIHSLGMDIVKTHTYDNCIRKRVSDSYLYLENNCDIPLEVGGKYLYADQWHPFRKLIAPHDQESEFGYDFQIDYIERP